MLIDLANNFLTLLFTWQGVAITLTLILRRPLSQVINRFISGGSGKARIGPIEIELGKLAEDGQNAINRLNDINLVMAKSRAQELEITLNTFGHALSKSQKEQMLSHITHLKDLASQK
ncbi:hypothetical protein I0D00_09225 [Pseudomonas lalucatii]|uniref:Uncharacterized protein n=1 Tax=Pseudomonas lalucatii TaxID=1424203 RepID=A0ABS5Q048_9PSED|nr:hypothetical protein [Pseudomonas lalucatii]MBS7662117.1 hypothetical protein [Pseudomonas lalucatii]MBS7726100.1 hypothetical protein [Pseudomonas lalucatii]